ncbi:hypothetical protein CRENBAI_003137 [Crenichthys baileyi]|uniref:Uncharacterized protein n=1 Tax=Crenichthys baileyi TaxID=28760 RepID=A0AAV9SFU1_9TELE
MSKNGTWPGNVAMESLSNMDSAGSCDSVISTNSVWSEDSMEHLSAEEKACLMYLEETIEALEVREDSGISNDEPDVWSKTEPQDQLRGNDVPIEILESGSHAISRPSSHAAADPPPTGLPTESKTVHHAANQISKPQFASTSVVDLKEDLTVETDPPVSDPAGYTTSLTEKTTKDSKLDGDAVPENFTNSAEALEISLDVIPPPTDFMDEPDLDLPPDMMTVVPPPVNGSAKQKPTVDLKQMHLRASLKKSFVSPSAEDSPSKHSEVASLIPQMGPSPEFSEPRSPPAVAPKPKKLPSNIILKSQKTPTPVSHGNPGHSVLSQGDRMLLDPQKVRIEALRKLGLLKDNVKESRGSQSHSPPVSPVAPHTPPITPSLTPGNNPLSALAPQTSVSAPVVLLSAASASPPIQDADILPAPAAFSDPTDPSGNKLPAVTFSTPPNTPPALLKQLTPPKVVSMKAATLERSGLGLSSQMSSQWLSERVSDDQDPKQLRNTRPRPASLGSGKDFSSTKGEGLVQSGPSDSRKPLPTQAFHHRGSAKLPRSQGISVLICPRAENEEDRREALKKERVSQKKEVKFWFKKAKLSMHRGNLQAASSFLHQAVALAHQTHNNQAIIYTYSQMANLAYIQGHLDSAEKLFKAAMSFMLAGGTPEDDNAVIEMSLKLATIYAEQNKAELAEHGFRFCMESLEAKLEKHKELPEDEKTEEQEVLRKDTHLLLGLCLDSRARYRASMLHLNQAGEDYRKALDICRQEHGETHPQTLVLMSDLATILDLQGRHDDALVLIQQAVDLSHSMEHPDHHVLLGNLAGVLLHTGRLEDSVRFYQEALGLARQAGDQAAVKQIQEGLKEVKKRRSQERNDPTEEVAQ